jgi:hypothetical protein
VVALVFSGDSSEPILVLKISRTIDEGHCLAREAASLRSLQEARPGGFDSVPRLVFYDAFDGEDLLVETALPGPLMRPSAVRSAFGECLDSVLRWIVDFHRATGRPGSWNPSSFARLVEAPLAALDRLPASSGAPQVLSRTRECAEKLSQMRLPLVFEHGDLGSPNLIRLSRRRVGVVDWELSDPAGLPAVDLFFCLSFLACARRGARTPQDCVAAFHEAFFGPDAWARPHVLRYAQAVGLPREALEPLFVLCWGRYVASLAARTRSADQRSAVGDEERWVAGERHLSLWQHAVSHMGELRYAA